MKKFFKIKYNDFICPNCENKLYVPDIIKALRIQYEPDTDASGYLSLLNTKCECGNRVKIYCDCHELNDTVTVVVNKIKKLAVFGDKNND